MLQGYLSRSVRGLSLSHAFGVQHCRPLEHPLYTALLGEAPHPEMSNEEFYQLEVSYPGYRRAEVSFEELLGDAVVASKGEIVFPVVRRGGFPVMGWAIFDKPEGGTWYAAAPLEPVNPKTGDALYFPHNGLRIGWR